MCPTCLSVLRHCRYLSAAFSPPFLERLPWLLIRWSATRWRRTFATTATFASSGLPPCAQHPPKRFLQPRPFPARPVLVLFLFLCASGKNSQGRGEGEGRDPIWCSGDWQVHPEEVIETTYAVSIEDLTEICFVDRADGMPTTLFVAPAAPHAHPSCAL